MTYRVNLVFIFKMAVVLATTLVTAYCFLETLSDFIKKTVLTCMDEYVSSHRHRQFEPLFLTRSDWN